MQRALWKGAISFGLVLIPVELFPAEKHADLDLTMLDRRDFSRIGYKRVNKKTGEEVAWENIVKGYEYEHEQFVVLSDEDLRRANVEATQTIDIQAFVDARQIPLTFYEQPYYLVPTKQGRKVYALLRETLRQSDKIGVAQVVIRTKQHLAALVAMGDTIVLNTLRYADEIRAADEFDLPETKAGSAGITDKELKMALALVEGMTEKWDPSHYHDTYREDVLALVEKKVEAHQTKTITLPEKEEKIAQAAEVIDLMALLKRSIASKGGKAAPPANDEDIGGEVEEKSAKKRAKSSNGGHGKAAGGRRA
ncbi:MAG: Ku protein [Sulfuricella sp.]|nr:Ku protein [Sulfuricella sp.]